MLNGDGCVLPSRFYWGIKNAYIDDDTIDGTHPQKFVNVILLGLAFMLVFTAFQTSGMIEQMVLDSFSKEHEEFTGSGFASLAIVYVVFAAANWIAPAIISIITAKWSMIIGGIIYTLFVALFLYPYNWSLYLGSVLLGFAAAVIWTGQGNFLTINSDSTTIARNSGLFWAILQCSLLFGNIFVFFQLDGATTIDNSQRYIIFGVLTAVSVVGVIVMFFFRTSTKKEVDISNAIEAKEDEISPMQSILRALQLIKTKRMILLSFTFFFTGLELSFFSGVYGTYLSRMLAFGDAAKSIVPLNGISIGVGEILGGATFGLLGKKTIRYGRDPIILLGYVAFMVGFFLAFLNVPSQAFYDVTNAESYIPSSKGVALGCSFLFGLADSCFNTQCYSIVGALYPKESVPAFALFKFMQSLSAAVAFFYSLGLEMQYQLLILAIFGTIGTVTFCIVEWDIHVENKKNFRKEIATEQ
ncbi:DUF895 domain membrane protein [Chamberlinius hualienensis]